MNANHERGILDQPFSFHQTSERGNDNTNENERARTNESPTKRATEARRTRRFVGGGVFLFARAPLPYPSSLKLHHLQISKKLQSFKTTVDAWSLAPLSIIFPPCSEPDLKIRGEPFFFYSKNLLLGFWGYARRISRDGRCSGGAIHTSMSDARL